VEVPLIVSVVVVILRPASKIGRGKGGGKSD